MMIPVCGTKLWGNESKYVQDCLDTGWLSSLGKYVTLFEEQFAATVGVKHAIACSSGTAGLFTALRILGIGPGDEVIIPDFTIIVSANVVILNGATPVLVDVEPDTWCLDPAKVEAAITPRTKAMMVVHMYGHPADMPRLQAIAAKHRLALIEDCCESHGATLNGRMTGSFSDIAVFSFYANKILTTGEGGMILTNHDAYAQRIRTFIDNGFGYPRFKHAVVGFNFRLSNLQAAVGLAQVEHLEEAVVRKRAIAERYRDRLQRCPHLVLPVERPGARNVYWMFGVLIQPSFGRSKDEVMRALKDREIDTRSFFYPMHEQPCFQSGRQPLAPNLRGSWPVSSLLGQRGLYLPSGLDLTDEQIDHVTAQLLSLIR